MNRDRIYSLPLEKVGSFAFDEQVAEVFPDMISRSVPGYASILSFIEQLASRYVATDSNVYDLGCSLGAASFLIQKQAPPTATIFAIDNSSAMIAKLRKRLESSLQEEVGERQVCSVIPVEASIENVDIENASFVVLNFTLQFVPAAFRNELIHKIWSGLRDDGVLILSEKICSENDLENQVLSELHHDFKRANGYSDLEIAQKRTALENRLIPETMSTHISRLRETGFEQVIPWFQCFNFVSILAVKKRDILK